MIKDVPNAIMIHLFDLLFIFTHGKLFELARVSNDFIDSLLLLELVNISLVVIDAIGDDLVDMIIVSVMDLGLIEYVILEVIRSSLRRYPDFSQPETRNEAVLQEDLVLIDLVSCMERLSERSELLDVSLSFSWAYSTQKLKLIMPVLMLNQQVDINSYVIDSFDIDLFQNISQSSLVDVLLKRMEIQLECLILTHDWTPEIEDFIHWVLFKSCKAYGLLENEGMIFEKLLTVVALSKELWNFRPSPDNEGFFES